MPTDLIPKFESRKWILLTLAVAFLLAGIYFQLERGESGRRFASNSILRIGIVLMALWIALPALKKPLSWLPPGIVAACLIGIGVVAVQPKSIFILAPAAATALTIAGIARFFRRR